MIDKKQIPFMVSLINDESPSVRNNVLKSFSEFGPELYSILNEVDTGLDENGMKYIFKLMTDYIIEHPEYNTFSDYKIGSKIKHKNYHYDGLIVDIDFYCFANDEWYQNNNTKPDKCQPWYHVLVNDSSMVTYAAQSNLYSGDEENLDISHPYINHFFDKNNEGVYIRNDKPWPREY
jgi:heat shock protein HspQ